MNKKYKKQVVEPDNGYMGLSSVTVGAGGGGGGGIDLLWTNASPRVAFGAQTVSIDLTNYDAVIIESMPSTPMDYLFPDNRDPATGYPYNHYLFQRVFMNKDESGELLLGSTIRYTDASTTTGTVAHRTVSISDSGVVFGGGYLNSSAYNGAAVPVKIYGVKGTLPTT